MEKLNTNYQILYETKYSYKDLKNKNFAFIYMIALFLINFSLFITLITSLILLDKLLLSFLILFAILFIDVSFYFAIFKIKVDAKITDKGLIFQNKMFSNFIKWEDIKSYELKRNFLNLEIKNMKYIGLGFPVKEQDNDKIKNIMKFYIKLDK